jgi:hypothetical protein
MSTVYLLFFARKITTSGRLKQGSKDCAVLPKSLNQAFSQSKKTGTDRALFQAAEYGSDSCHHLTKRDRKFDSSE